MLLSLSVHLDCFRSSYNHDSNNPFRGSNPFAFVLGFGSVPTTTSQQPSARSSSKKLEARSSRLASNPRKGNKHVPFIIVSASFDSSFNLWSSELLEIAEKLPIVFSNNSDVPYRTVPYRTTLYHTAVSTYIFTYAH